MRSEQKDRPMKVLGADVSQGNLLVHFSDGTSVLFQSHFLDEVRAHDGNVAIADEEAPEDE